MPANDFPDHTIVTEADLRTLQYLKELLPVVYTADDDAQIMVARKQRMRPDDTSSTPIFEAAIVRRQRSDSSGETYVGPSTGTTREEALKRLVVQIEDVLADSWHYFGLPVRHGGSGGGHGGGGGHGDGHEGGHGDERGSGAQGGNGAQDRGEKREASNNIDDQSGSAKKAKVEGRAEGRGGDTIVEKGGEAPGNGTKHATQRPNRRRKLPMLSIAGGLYTAALSSS